MTVPTDHRLIFEVDLAPTSGARFQPTGFPDLGPAEYQRPVVTDGEVTWVDALLVESAQSMANRLEDTAWDATADRPHPALDGLPWVRVEHADTGEYLTSSRTEAHRLASAFIKDSTLDGTGMREVIRERLGLRDDRPLSYRAISAAVMALDPLCLIHGVFFAEPAGVWPGQPKIPRALTGFVEAVDVRPAHSGGVKRDHVRHGIEEGAGGSSEGYGTIPFHRTEYTAARIVGHFVLDRDQLRSYGLGDAAADLLEAVALWEVRRLLDAGMRLRTACDLAAAAPPVDQSGAPLPDADELAGRIRRGVEACRDLLGDGGPLTVTWNPKAAKARTKK